MKTYKPSTEELDKKLDKLIAEKFSSNCMSNRKWIKLIDSLVENAELIKRVEFKKVLEEKIGLLFITKDIQYEFDYWNIGFEGVNSFGGWLLYKEIEFLKFPSQFQHGEKVEKQNLVEIKKVIDKLGQFDMFIQDDELTLLCYK